MYFDPVAQAFVSIIDNPITKKLIKIVKYIGHDKCVLEEFVSPEVQCYFINNDKYINNIISVLHYKKSNIYNFEDVSKIINNISLEKDTFVGFSFSDTHKTMSISKPGKIKNINIDINKDVFSIIFSIDDISYSCVARLIGVG